MEYAAVAAVTVIEKGDCHKAGNAVGKFLCKAHFGKKRLVFRWNLWYHIWAFMCRFFTALGLAMKWGLMPGSTVRDIRAGSPLPQPKGVGMNV